MKHISLKTIILIILTFLVYNSCSVEASEGFSLEIGQDFINPNIRVISIDTFKVSMSTMRFDSIRTSGTNRLLFGQYNDLNFGKVKANPYFELTPSNYFIHEDATIDSIGLVLLYDKYFYNDTTQVSNLNIHKLTNRLDSNDSFYNTSLVNFNSSPLASINFYAEPNSDSLYIPLPINFGSEIFNNIKNNVIEDRESFLQRYNGFTLKNNLSDDSSILGFSTNSSIKIYYNIPGELNDDEKVLDLLISGNSFFNNIEGNVNGLPLENLTDQEEVLYSNESNNLSYIQSGTGYATRLELPSIKKILEIQGRGTVLNAILKIIPKSNSYSDIRPLEETLNLFITDQNNDITEQLALDTNPIVARLNRDDVEFGNIYYSVPILDFVNRKLTEQPETEDALVLMPEFFNSTVNGIIFNDAFSDNYQAKLVITYAIYNE